MTCPKCASEKSIVVGTKKGVKNVRLRACKDCNFTWQTVENIVYTEGMREYLEYSIEVKTLNKKEVDDATQTI